MRDYFEKEICANCCIDKQFCDRCGVRKKTANPEKKKPALMARLQESDKNCDGNCKNCVAICGTTQNTIFLEAADAIEELLGAVPKWVSVEERLPKFHMNDSGCVCTKNIVFRTEYKTVHLGYVIRTAHNIETVEGFEQILIDRWYDQTGDMIEGVTHWMPLPEPPKEDTDNV